MSKPVRQEELQDKLRKALERQKKKSRPQSGAALAGRPSRDVLLAVPGEADRAQIVALLGEVTSVTAEDGPALARRAKLYECHAMVIDPTLREPLTAIWTRWHSVVADGLRRGLADGSVAPEVKPDQAAEQLITLVDGLCTRWLSGTMPREEAVGLLRSRLQELAA